MAISFQEIPDNYNTTGNPLRYVFTSNQTTQANFSYQVRVVVAGIEVEVHKVFVTQGTYGYFDATDIAERYAKVPIPNDTIEWDAGNEVQIKVTVYENYGTPPVNVGSVNNTQDYVKSKLSKQKWLQHIPSSYIFANNAKWLTNYPSTLKRYIDLNYDNVLTFITNRGSLFVTVEAFDSSGVLINTNSYSVTSYKVTNFTIRRSTLLGLGFTSGEIDDTSYLTVQLTDGVGGFSEKQTLWIDDRCVRLEASYIMFLTSIGELFTYKFTNNTRTSGSVKSISLETNFGQLDDDGTFAYSRGGLEDKIKIYKEEIEVSTDWLTETEQQWLVKELATSPVVYWWNGIEWQRVRVSRSSYEYKQDKVDMTFRETFKIETNNDTSTVV